MEFNQTTAPMKPFLPSMHRTIRQPLSLKHSQTGTRALAICHFSDFPTMVKLGEVNSGDGASIRKCRGFRGLRDFFMGFHGFFTRFSRGSIVVSRVAQKQG
jgi:hypothetical protein